VWIIGSLWAIAGLALFLLTVVVPWGCWVSDGNLGSSQGCESMLGWWVPFIEPQPTFAVTVLISTPLLILAASWISISRWRWVHGR
jgi:hypothetical protein